MKNFAYGPPMINDAAATLHIQLYNAFLRQFLFYGNPEILNSGCLCLIELLNLV